MTHIVSTERPIYYATSYADDVAHTGQLPISGALATSLPVVYADNEHEFLQQAVGLVSNYNPLPDSGELEAGEIYGYGDGLVIVRQSHSRTEHEPADVPALFSVYRPDADGALEWITNEPVLVGTQREYGGVLYQAIQAHTTQAQWTPDVTPALWSVVEDEPSIDAWQVGVSYSVGDEVTHNGATYRCLQAHTSQAGWQPPNVPALWQVVE